MLVTWVVAAPANAGAGGSSSSGAAAGSTFSVRLSEVQHDMLTLRCLHPSILPATVREKLAGLSKAAAAAGQQAALAGKKRKAAGGSGGSSGAALKASEQVTVEATLQLVTGPPRSAAVVPVTAAENVAAAGKVRPARSGKR